MRRVERDHFDLRLNIHRKQGLQIINESIGELIGIRRQRRAHAAAGKAFWFAGRTGVRVGYAQGVGHDVKYDAFGLDAPVSDSAGAGGAQGCVDGVMGLTPSPNPGQ